jgi:hypothetical protein
MGAGNLPWRPIRERNCNTLHDHVRKKQNNGVIAVSIASKPHGFQGLMNPGMNQTTPHPGTRPDNNKGKCFAPEQQHNPF